MTITLVDQRLAVFLDFFFENLLLLYTWPTKALVQKLADFRNLELSKNEQLLVCIIYVV